MSFTQDVQFSVITRIDNTSVVKVMHRKMTEDIYQFIVNRGFLTKENVPMVPALYIHGPHGVGKSHSLFEVVCLLRNNPNNRVIYIPDCGGWLGSIDPVDFLLNNICYSFAEDTEVIELCSLVKKEYDMKILLCDFLPKYCLRNNLQLYGIFDQHNALTVLFYTSSFIKTFFSLKSEKPFHLIFWKRIFLYIGRGIHF